VGAWRRRVICYSIRIRRTVSERVNITSIEQVQIVRAELCPNAGLIGAGVWVSQKAAQTTALTGEAQETR
jgi:hypothetical protein